MKEVRQRPRHETGSAGSDTQPVLTRADQTLAANVEAQLVRLVVQMDGVLGAGPKQPMKQC